MTEVENCKNCNTIITDKFCGACGQKKYSRIDKNYLKDEIQYTLLHTNKGFFHTIKMLLKNPGKMARSFVEGSRVNHYKPILLVFVLGGLSTAISFKFLNLTEMMSTLYQDMSPDVAKVQTKVYKVMTNYMSFVNLAMIPFFALLTKIVFRKWGQNYWEHIVMNAYFYSFNTLCTILIFYPILYFCLGNPQLYMQITSASFFFTFVLLAWFYKGFYIEKPFKSILIRILAIFGLLIVGFALLMVVSVIMGVLIGMFFGKEALVG